MDTTDRRERDIRQQEKYIESLSVRIAEKQGEIAKYQKAIKQGSEEFEKSKADHEALMTRFRSEIKELGFQIQEIDQERVEANTYLKDLEDA